MFSCNYFQIAKVVRQAAKSQHSVVAITTRLNCTPQVVIFLEAGNKNSMANLIEISTKFNYLYCLLLIYTLFVEQ